jgi:hypothetical protein
MLESYLSQETIPIPNLQEEANNLVNTVIKQGPKEGSTSTSTSASEGENAAPVPSRSPARPKNPRHYETEIHLSPEEMAKLPPKMDAKVQVAMSNMRRQLPGRPKALDERGDEKPTR